MSKNEIIHFTFELDICEAHFNNALAPLCPLGGADRRHTDMICRVVLAVVRQGTYAISIKVQCVVMNWWGGGGDRPGGQDAWPADRVAKG